MPIPSDGGWQARVVIAADPTRFAPGTGTMLVGANTAWEEDESGRWIPAEDVEAVESTDRIGLAEWRGNLISWADGNQIRGSRDASSWSDARVQPDEGNPSALVQFGGELMLLGEGTHVRVGAWRSSDGSTWAGVEGSPTGMKAGAPAGTAGMVAVGWMGPSAAAWITADGLAWSPIPFPQPPDGATSALSGVAAGRGRVVAIGDVNGAAAVWSSADLAHWTRSAQPTRDDELLARVVNAGGLFVIAGQRHDRPVIWLSADGLTWASVALPLPPNISGEVSDVVSDGGRVVAFGSTTEDAGNGGASRTGYLVWTLDTDK